MSDFVIRPLAENVLEQLRAGKTVFNGNPVKSVRADASPGYPCRISLRDASKGEDLFLVSHRPFTKANPYRETGPVFIRKNAQSAKLKVNQLPEIVLSRQVVVRAYDSTGTMLAAIPAQGDDAASQIRECLAGPGVEFVHIRAALTGCFLCEARRA